MSGITKAKDEKTVRSNTFKFNHLRIESTMSAPKGNQNARNAKECRDALRYALNNYESSTVKKGQALREIATQLIKKALGGDMQAIKEIVDRLGGDNGKTH